MWLSKSIKLYTFEPLSVYRFYFNYSNRQLYRLLQLAKAQKGEQATANSYKLVEKWRWRYDILMSKDVSK